MVERKKKIFPEGINLVPTIKDFTVLLGKKNQYKIFESAIIICWSVWKKKSIGKVKMRRRKIPDWAIIIRKGS